MVPDGFDVAVEFFGVADSKKLSEKRREQLFEQLVARERAGDVSFCVEFGEHTAIDVEGIAPTVRHAVYAGVQKLAPNAEGVRVYLDGSLHAPKEYKQETIIGGDASVPLISLASIAAKVTRDRLMLKYHDDFPVYDFAKHKGYGTKFHYEMLAEHGPCPIHRLSFLHAT